VTAYDNAAAVASDFWGSPVLKAEDGTLYCPGFVGETESKHPWNAVLFESTVKTPGVCEVKVTKSQDADVKQAKGSDGAKVTTHGVRPAEVEIAVKVWTPEQYKRLRELWALVMPKAGKGQGKATDVHHPTLKLHDIKSIIVLRGEGPAPGPEPRTRVFTIYGIEYIATSKKKVTKTPVAPKGSLYDPGKEGQGQAQARPTAGSNPRNTNP
jgi:hypothetical protein